jgi:hypothetical protein
MAGNDIALGYMVSTILHSVNHGVGVAAVYDSWDPIAATPAVVLLVLLSLPHVQPFLTARCVSRVGW